jgi:hypothetical protein
MSRSSSTRKSVPPRVSRPHFVAFDPGAAFGGTPAVAVVMRQWFATAAAITDATGLPGA